jgi:glucosamine-phosphate N-acetyltransferase
MSTEKSVPIDESHARWMNIDNGDGKPYGDGRTEKSNKPSSLEPENTSLLDGNIYDPTMLANIPWSQESQAKFKPGISPTSPGVGLVLRPLRIEDDQKGFLTLLAMLTSVGHVSAEDFRNQFEVMAMCPNSYYVTVIEDVEQGRVVGCATLIVEYKFIHSAGTRGRIEDVVVSDAYRGRQLGKLLLETLTLMGRHNVGCYKMSLECKDSLIKFYEQFGYEKDPGNNYLQQRFKV